MFQDLFISIQTIVIILKSKVIKIITKSVENKVVYHSETMHT